MSAGELDRQSHQDLGPAGGPPSGEPVSPATTCSRMVSAFSLTASARRPPRGCWGTARGNSGMPRDRRSTFPKVTNKWVQTVTVGMPRRSNSTASWILHDVQEPQSPKPTTTASAEATSWSSTSSEAGMEAVGFWA